MDSTVKKYKKKKYRRSWEKRTVKIKSSDNSTLLPRKADPPKLIKKMQNTC